jgi:hypothetical protein
MARAEITERGNEELTLTLQALQTEIKTRLG